MKKDKIEQEIEQLTQEVASVEQESANNNNDIEELYGIIGDLERKILVLEREITNSNIANYDASVMQGKLYCLKERLQDAKQQLGALKANRKHKR